MKRLIKSLVQIGTILMVINILILSLCIPMSFGYNNTTKPLNLSIISDDVTIKNYFGNHGFNDKIFNKNILVSEEKFKNILNDKLLLKNNLANGNILSLFSFESTNLQFDNEINSPIVIPINNENGVKTISRTYFIDEQDRLNIQDVKVPYSYSKQKSLDVLSKVLDQQIKSKIKKSNVYFINSLISTSYADSNWKGLGSYSVYVEGPPRGDLQIVYDFETLQNSGGKDYYAMHAYLTGTPGDVLSHTKSNYEDKWDSDLLTASISINEPSSGATLYKHGPNTTTNESSYGVDIGVSGGNTGAAGTFSLSWNRSCNDVDISKQLKANTYCYWECDIDDWTSVADNSWTFEPGATAMVPQNTSKVNIYFETKYTTDSWNTFPEVACESFVYIDCYPDRISY